MTLTDKYFCLFRMRGEFLRVFYSLGWQDVNAAHYWNIISLLDATLVKHGKWGDV